ncbi:hypothetical protein B0T22DRAFT_232805 [Podospora appendiculata]|uniref:Tetratricopeptide SHNi-TPR domain-containing protein n=1 Tax=Podospora appendiculata TaxID=314037 RepID=A0AAE0X5V4_9PEZI|nr:hypothetical protein B0T22DRAFT_232805 [Podospora appendiculata]
MATEVANSGTSTPIVELDSEQLAHSLKVSLADLSAKAAALYAHKSYEEAAEVYAQAAEMQAEINGEMSPENADILFLYGRALFKVGQSKSDVLGGGAPETKKSKPAPKPAKQAKAAVSGSNGAQQPQNGEGSSATAAAAGKKEEPSAENKPMFKFEGDENFEDSDEEAGAEEGEGEGDKDEEEDDLAVAFEILDLARVLFNKKLEAVLAEPEVEEGKGKEEAEATAAEGDSPTVRHIKERLADTHDLLAEISLENERYPNAITDSRASLAFKKQLYSQDSEIIAEAHFKLSLALEFASMTKPSDDDNAEGESKESDSANNTHIDQSLRDEAADELEAAIASTRLKLQNKEVELATLHSPEDNDFTRQQITEVKEVIADMEQRLVDLRGPPIDINSALGLPPRGGTATQQDASDEIKKNANDLSASGLVRRKRKATEEAVEGEDGLESKKPHAAN